LLVVKLGCQVFQSASRTGPSEEEHFRLFGKEAALVRTEKYPYSLPWFFRRLCVFDIFQQDHGLFGQVQDLVADTSWTMFGSTLRHLTKEK
jgi:hypothetical protein